MSKKTIATISVLALLLLMATQHVYYVRRGADGSLLWDENQAYLFVNIGYLGYRLPYIEYPIEVIKSYFGNVALPNYKRYSVVVFKITLDKVERFTTDDLSIDLLTPIDGSIYADHDGALWKWINTHFEPASVFEQSRLDGIKKLSGLNVTNVDGWSKRANLLSQSQEVGVLLPLKGRSASVVVRRDAEGFSVELIREEGKVEEILRLKEKPQRVSRDDYESLFMPK